MGIPNGETGNQIDHVLIGSHHSSDILDVNACRGADIDSDHFLTRIRYKQKPSLIRATKAAPIEKFEVGKLEAERIMEQFTTGMSTRLSSRQEEWIRKMWKGYGECQWKMYLK